MELTPKQLKDALAKQARAAECELLARNIASDVFALTNELSTVTGKFLTGEDAAMMSAFRKWMSRTTKMLQDEINNPSILETPDV